MKSMWLFGSVLIGLLVYQVYDKWIQDERAKCLFFRGGECITCDRMDAWPVGYKENCSCHNKMAYYVEEGLFPAWQCVKREESEEKIPDVGPVSINSKPCPKHHPLRDILGNCYACDTPTPVRIAHAEKGAVCGQKRYTTPDQFVDKSQLCPILSDIQDSEVCVACGGVVWNGKCFNEGENHFCVENHDCPNDEWCFPLRQYKYKQGVCTKRTKHRWFCSVTDGYDLATTKDICMRQGMHIPTLEEIEMAEEDLSQLCPTLDMWAFFAPDGVVWLESFTREFLFTREAESDKLGGHTFHALCHIDN